MFNFHQLPNISQCVAQVAGSDSAYSSPTTLSRANSANIVELQVNGGAQTVAPSVLPTTMALPVASDHLQELEPLTLEDLTQWMDGGAFDGSADLDATQTRGDELGVTHLLRADICPRILAHRLNARHQQLNQIHVPGSALGAGQQALVSVSSVLADFRPTENARDVLQAKDASGTGLTERAEHLGKTQAQRLFEELKISQDSILKPEERQDFVDACNHSSSRAIEYIIARQPDLDQKFSGGCTFLQFAISEKLDELACFLIQQGAEVNTVDDDGDSPLIDACRHKNVELALVLLSVGADPHIKNQEGMTALQNAAKKGSVLLVRELLKKGVDIDHQKHDHFNALHLAALNDHPSVVRALLDAGANPRIPISAGSTALHLATLKAYDQVVRALLAKILELDPDFVNEKALHGISPLHLAAQQSNVNTCKLLLEAGADLDIKDSNGDTPLHCAALKDCGPMINFLISKGAKVAIKNEDGRTPLHLAISEGHLESARAFFEAGVSSNQSGSGKTKPIHFAVGSGQLAMVNLVLEQQPRINAVQHAGFTALHAAALAGHEDIARRLIEAGIDTQIQGHNGITAKILAQIAGQGAIAEVIAQAQSM